MVGTPVTPFRSATTSLVDAVGRFYRNLLSFVKWTQSRPFPSGMLGYPGQHVVKATFGTMTPETPSGSCVTFSEAG